MVTKSNDEYINILKSVNDTKDLVVYIIDLLNISRDINLIREYFDNKVLLVLNKRDILPKSIKDEKPYPYGMIAYLVKNTITENGAVKRGVCEIDGDVLNKITESSVERIDGKIIAKPLSGSEPFEVDEDDTVSMNMLLFTPSIFDYIESHFKEFLDSNKDNLEKCEYLIPDVLFDTIKEGYATAKVIKTTSTWYGVTYKEDAEGVKKALKKLVDENVYPNHLWSE